MISYFGDFAEDDTVLIPFNTFSSDDPSASVTITNLADADIKVHKDGGTTQIATDGATVAIDYDGITGNHLVTIDTSAHADYATGSEYAVRVEGTTVDGATVNAWIGAFSIERAGGALAVAKLIQTAVITNAAGTDIAADIIAVKAETATIVADTNELQSDDVPGLIATAQADLDILTGTDGATLATSQANYAPAKAGDNMGTVSSVTGNVDGSVASVTAAVTTDAASRTASQADVSSLATQASVDTNTTHLTDIKGTDFVKDTHSLDDIQAFTAAILGDTNELQTDWADGGRLDLLLDDVPTTAEFEARTPTAAQLAYIVENAATGMPVTFTTSGGSTTAAVINQVDGASGSATDDQYNGRLLVFTNGTLKGVVTDITDYDGGTTTATITAIPFAPTASHTARLI